MLRDLDVRDGMRVLDLGTGTGWNAGLLARRLGDRQVTSIEVDPAVAAAAVDALHTAGLYPEVVVGDGLLGHPPGAPYDRVIATMAVRSVPRAWLTQTVPGGVIVAPWGSYYSHADAVVRLTVSDDRRHAHGPFTRPVEFMKARTQRLARAAHGEYVTGGDVAAAADYVTGTSLCAADLGHPFAFVAGLFTGRDCVSAADRRGAEVCFWLYGISDRSWAAAVLRDGRRTSAVYLGGPRRLWAGIVAAHRWWTGAGCPDVTRFGLTVTPDPEIAWFETPHQPLPAPPDAAPAARHAQPNA
jgi:protein-L-isoaspartate O-methyltransferase